METFHQFQFNQEAQEETETTPEEEPEAEETENSVYNFNEILDSILGDE